MMMNEMLMVLLGAVVVMAGLAGAVLVAVAVAVKLVFVMFRLAVFVGAATLIGALMGLL
jgi:hypothetical protein